MYIFFITCSGNFGKVLTTGSKKQTASKISIPESNFIFPHSSKDEFTAVLIDDDNRSFFRVENGSGKDPHFLDFYHFFSTN